MMVPSTLYVNIICSFGSSTIKNNVYLPKIMKHSFVVIVAFFVTNQESHLISVKSDEINHCAVFCAFDTLVVNLNNAIIVADTS